MGRVHKVENSALRIMPNFWEFFVALKLGVGVSRDSGNDFAHFSFQFLEGRIPVILICQISTQSETTEDKRSQI